MIGVPAASPAAPAPAAPPVSAGPAADLPRTLQGLLVETKGFALVGYRPPYDYQLNDSEGKRIAFLDVSKVAPLQKMEPYVDRMVTVSGVIKPTNDWDEPRCRSADASDEMISSAARITATLFPHHSWNSSTATGSPRKSSAS